MNTDKKLKKINDFCEQVQCTICPLFEDEYRCLLQEVEDEYNECRDKVNELYKRIAEIEKADRSANQSAK